MKTCTKCGEAKLKVEFGKRKASKDGLQARCKACVNAASAAYYDENREKVRAANAAWKEANPDKVAAAYTAWKEANRDKKRATDAAWKKANPGKVRANGTAWQKANREKVNAATAAWRAANPDKQGAARAAWAKANPDKCRAYCHNHRALKRANGGTLSLNIAEIKMEAQGGLCICCGMPLAEWHIDHIEPVAKGGPNTDDNVQLLLPRCNQRKGVKTMDEYMRTKKEAA